MRAQTQTRAVTRLSVVPLLSMLSAVIITAGCNTRERRPDAGPGPGTETLALVGSERIEARELAFRVGEQASGLRDRYARSTEARKELLTKMIEEELIIALAKKRGLDRDPRFRRIMHHHLVRLIREDVLRMVKLDQIGDDKARAYYERNKGKYSRPARTRARQIVLKDEKTAQRLAAQAQGKSEQRFAALARRHSIDAATRKSGGDLGTLVAPLRPRGALSREVIAALGELKTAGQISAPVESPAGWHIIRLTELVPRELHPFEQVKVTARIAAFKEERERVFQKFLRELWASERVQLFPANLEKVKRHLP